MAVNKILSQQCSVSLYDIITIIMGVIGVTCGIHYDNMNHESKATNPIGIHIVSSDKIKQIISL